MTLREPEESMELVSDESREWLLKDFRRTDRMKQGRGKDFLDYVGPLIVAGVFTGLGYLIYWGVTDFVPSLRNRQTNPNQSYGQTAPADSLEASSAEEDTLYFTR